MARKTLKKWIDEAMVDKDKDGPLTALVLMHVVNGVDKTEIHTSKLGRSNQMGAEEYAKMFRDKAETYGQDFQGPQRFTVLAFYGDDNDEPQARFPFLVSPPPPDEEMGTEPPTETGRMSQMMRHYETGMAQIFRRQITQDDHSIRMQDLMSRQIHQLMNDNAQMFELTKTLVKAQLLDQHELRMKELERESANDMKRGLLRMAPALANTITGRELFPQHSADTALIESIALGLDEDMLKAIPMIAPQALAGPLLQRLVDIRERHAAEQAKAKQLAVRTNDSDITEGGEE
jgi:hypothetical protein